MAKMNNGSLYERESTSHKILRVVVNNLMYILLGICVIVLSRITPFFLTKNNIFAIFRDSAAIMIVSIGMTFMMTSGQTDLSVGSIVLTSASMAGLLIKYANMNCYLSLPLMIVIGTILGAVNGFLIVKMELNPWLVTLGMQLGLKGFSYIFTYADTIRLPKEFKTMRDAGIGKFPFYAMVALLMFLIMNRVMTRTIFGRNVVAVGTDEVAATRIGIDVKKTKFLVYVLMGFMCGIAACMTTINMTAVTRDCGKAYEFLGVAMSVIGHCSMSGGQCSVFPGTLLGVLMIQFMENGLSIIGLDPYYFPILRGVIIFIGMMIDTQKIKKTS